MGVSKVALATMLFWMLVLSLAVVDGFACHSISINRATHALEAKHLSTSTTAHRSPFLNVSPSSTSRWNSGSLGMSDASYESSFTSTNVAEEEIGMTETEQLFQDMMETPKSTWNWGRRQLNELEINEILNTSFVVILSVVVLAKLTLVDAGMTRGWTTEELASRIAVDNWNDYLDVLRSNPIATKAATSATVYTIGDIIAQRTEGTSIGALDRPRILRSMLAGLIGHGPLSHFWYQISENFFDNVAHLTQWWSFIPKVVVDQSVWGPIWNNSYIILLGLMKLESFETIFGDMKRTTIPLIVSGLKLWPLAHCITYGLIPVENRLLWVDMVEILWVTILSAQAAGSIEETTLDVDSPEEQQ